MEVEAISNMDPTIDLPTSTALLEAQQVFGAAGLPCPYVPTEMRGQVARLEEWVYGTRADTSSLYDLGWFVREVGATPVQDYVLFGQAGHGLNSRAMHYYLVRGRLALFLQLAWNGAYENHAEATQVVSERFAQAEALSQAVETAQHQGRFDPTERLIVVASDFYGSSWRHWQTTADPTRFLMADGWHTSKTDRILSAVLTDVEQ